MVLAMPFVWPRNVQRWAYGLGNVHMPNGIQWGVVQRVRGWLLRAVMLACVFGFGYLLWTALFLVEGRDNSVPRTY